MGHARQKKALGSVRALGLGLGFFECRVGALELVGTDGDPLLEPGGELAKLVADAFVLADLASHDQDRGSAAIFDDAQVGIEDETGAVRTNVQKLERSVAEAADSVETGRMDVGRDAGHVELG